MKEQEQELKIYNTIHRLAQEQGLELVEVKIGRHNKDTMIQVLADKPEGGIGIGACTTLNRSIVEAIDKDDILSEDSYSLEVSSPGLDRPLVTYKDFLRNIDREVHLWLIEKVDGKKEPIGIILDATEEQLRIFITKEKKEITVPVNQIEKGLLVI